MTNNYSNEFDASNYNSGIDTFTKTFTVDIFAKSSDYSGTDYSPDYNIDKFVTNVTIKADTIVASLGRIKTFKVDIQTSITPKKTITVQIQTDQHSTKGIGVDIIAKALGTTKNITVDVIANIPDYAFSDYSAHDYDTGGIQYQQSFTAGIIIKQIRVVGIQVDVQAKQLGRVGKTFPVDIQIQRNANTKTNTVDILPVNRRTVTEQVDTQVQKKGILFTFTSSIQIRTTQTKTISVDILPVNRRNKTFIADIQIQQKGIKITFKTDIQTQKKGVIDTITTSITIVQHRTLTLKVDILAVRFLPFRVTGQNRRVIKLTGQNRPKILLTGQAV